MKTQAFISHSSADKSFVKKLAKRLEKDKIWVDFWNLDAGDILPQKIAEAIHLSKSFVLIASKASMASRWVRYELNIALIRWIQEADCRIIVVKIDDCEIHPELSPFLRIDCPGQPDKAIQEVTELIITEEEKGLAPARERRRRIINRFNEMAAIERLLHERISFIYLWGMYGIGKTTVIERVSQEIFNMPLARFPLTEAHGPLRLALELAARAKRTLPSSDVPDEKLLYSSVESCINLIDQGHLVFFDDVENALEEDGRLRPFLASIFENIHKYGELKTPIFLASTRRPYLIHQSADMQATSHIMHIDRLTDNDLLYCLENWLSLAQPGKSMPERDSLKEAVSYLFGYPLAARLAAYYIAQYSVDILLKEIIYFKNLRIDIAKQLLGRTRAELSELETNCLEALAVADTGMSLSELSVTLKCDIDSARNAVDKLTSSLIIFPEDGLLQIHPIVKDYFWSRVYETGAWKKLSQRLAVESKKRLSKLDPQGREFIHFCAKAYRLFAISGNLQEARSLLYDFKEELREVSRRLYHAGEYERALEYMALWLTAQSGDLDIRWLKARCLTRLGRNEEAESELSSLQTSGYRPYKVYHAWGLLRRDQHKYDEAVDYFRRGLHDWPEYVPLLRDLGDVLDRLDDVKGAIGILRKAYELSPRDPYVVPKYVDVLVKNKEYEEALAIIDGATKAFPEEAAFEHRLSTILERVGDLKGARTHARKAVELGAERLPEATLHLASLEVKYGELENAEELLLGLTTTSHRAKKVKNTILAEIKLRQGDMEKARSYINRKDARSDPYCAAILARIELEEARRAAGEGRSRIAKDCIKRAKEIINPLLTLNPDNAYLQDTIKNIDNLEAELK